MQVFDGEHLLTEAATQSPSTLHFLDGWQRVTQVAPPLVSKSEEERRERTVKNVATGSLKKKERKKGKEKGARNRYRRRSADKQGFL